eukprot:6518914-Lingulodinium_polyedra.AAC.1
MRESAHARPCLHARLLARGHARCAGVGTRARAWMHARTRARARARLGENAACMDAKCLSGRAREQTRNHVCMRHAGRMNARAPGTRGRARTRRSERVYMGAWARAHCAGEIVHVLTC